jgi:MFS family permease
MLHTLAEGGSGRTLLYLLGAQVAVQISGPYFTPYMLGHLQFSYAQFAILVSVAYVARIACLPALGRLARRWGAPRLLWLGGAAIVPVAGLWLVADSFFYLVLVQVVSGAAWATYELAMFLLFFERVPREKRVAVLTVFNLFNALAIVAGSVVGASLLALLGEHRSTYFALFLGSTTVRAAALLLMAKLPAKRLAFGWMRPVLLPFSVAFSRRRRLAEPGTWPPMTLRPDTVTPLPTLAFDPAGKKATAA